MNSYKVKRIDTTFKIDSEWNKEPWSSIEALSILEDNGWNMGYRPQVEVKICYDDKNIYLIYRSNDQYVRCLTDKIHGPVWQDSCAEFFFAPNPEEPTSYFNLEINCGGTALMSFHKLTRENTTKISVEEIKSIQIAHSLPKIIEEEIKEPVVWTLEAALPLSLIEKYSVIKQPLNGTKWRANFYKCAENNSFPHWISWNKIQNEKPAFHKPEFFGEIEFS